MIGKVSTRYALRSLTRRPRRTALSILGTGIGCALGLIGTAWVSGSAEMQIRAVAESGAGHLMIVRSGWLDNRENTLRLVDWERTQALASAVPGVKAAIMRARSNGLLAFGNRTSGVEVLGVVPEVEAVHNRIVSRGRIEGRYLTSEDEGKVVIGKMLARRLDVELEDDLQITMAGQDEIRSAMLEIVGLIDTGSRELDTSVCHINLQDMENISGFEGPGEIAILLNDYKRLESAKNSLVNVINPGNEVITWREVNPGIAGNVDGDTAFFRGLSAIVLIVVALGITSAQLTAVLERRREFAMLSALGMKSRHLVALIVLEAWLVGLCGALVALILGGSAAYHLATNGVSLASFVGEDFSFGNILIDPYMYGDFGVWLIWYALGVSLAATTAASIYPAWFVIQTRPAEALRVV